jgi:hypothetical protein
VSQRRCSLMASSRWYWQCWVRNAADELEEDEARRADKHAWSETSRWHNRTTNSDSDERKRSDDTTGLAGAPLSKHDWDVFDPSLPDHPGKTIDERMDRAKQEAELRKRGNIS